MNWAAYLNHLQAVLEEFDLIAAPNKDVLIWYIWNSFRPLTRAQLDKQDCDFDNCDNAIKKAIDTEDMAIRQSPLQIQEIDVCYSWGQWPYKIKDLTKDVEKSKSS